MKIVVRGERQVCSVRFPTAATMTWPMPLLQIAEHHGDRRSGDLAALSSEALYGEKLHLQSFHRLASFGSRRAPSASPEIFAHRPAHRRSYACGFRDYTNF